MRQTDTESVAYNFAFHNHNILLPQNSLIRPITNKNAYFFLEFPAYEYTVSFFYRIFGWHIEVARIVNIALYISAALSLFYFVKKYFQKNIAIFALFYFSFAPASIFFIGHAIHPDVFAVSMICISLAAIVKWKDSHNIFFLLASLAALSFSALTRPFVLIALPSFLFLLWDFKVKPYVYALFIGVPLALYGLWHIWTESFKATANVDWENWVFQGQSQLFTKSIFFERLLLKNVIGEVIGKISSLFVVFGLLSFLIRKNKQNVFLIFWLLLIPIYWVVAPNGNIIHQYYADVYLVPVIITAAVGTHFILEIINKKMKVLTLPLLAIIFIAVIYNGVHTSNYYFSDLLSATDQKIAKEINANLPVGAKLIYLQQDNSVVLSLYHRKGWILGYSPVDVAPDAVSILSMKKYGAQYIVNPLSSSSLSAKDKKIIEAKSSIVYSSALSTIYKIK
jgi:4-amino-4-deoxy-L-arabinose transferase-like glycosyltransferase